MLQCLFYVNDLPGGEAHHDGGMKGRDRRRSSSNPMLHADGGGVRARSSAAGGSRTRRSSPTARPAKGTAEPDAVDADVARTSRCRGPTSRSRRAPDPKRPTPRSAKKYREAAASSSRPISILRPASRRRSTLCPKAHHFEMSIEEQAATLLTDGLALQQPRAAAQRLLDLRRVPRRHRARRLRDVALPAQPHRLNEGLNVLMHFAARRRVHRPRSLLGLEPRLDQPGARLPAVPAPLLRAGRRARRRSSPSATPPRGYGGHIVAIPRDNLPVLTRPDGKTPLWNAGDAWTPVDPVRASGDGAKAAILTVGAPSYLAVAGERQGRGAGRRRRRPRRQRLPARRGVPRRRCRVGTRGSDARGWT